MASVSSVQSSDYTQQLREAERLQAERQARPQEPPPPPPPEAQDPNLGRNLDVTA